MLTLYERNVVEEILNALLENLSPLSRESYRASIVSFLRFSIARKQANPFQSPVSVFTSYKTELKKEYAPATVNKKLSAVREFFRYAYIHELITHEMYEGIRLVSNVRQSGEAWREWLDEDEAHALLEKADLLRDKVAVVLSVMVLVLSLAGLQQGVHKRPVGDERVSFHRPFLARREFAAAVDNALVLRQRCVG